MMTDPIADLITRIRNAGSAKHRQTACPSSKMKLAVAKVLRDSGFLGDVRVEARDGHPVLVMDIRYHRDGRALIGGIRRVSKPGRRVYVPRDAIPKVRNGLGVAVLSTPRGVLADRTAREAKVAGELLCEVW